MSEISCKECEKYKDIREGSIHQVKAMNCRVKPSDKVFFDIATPDTEWEKEALDSSCYTDTKVLPVEEVKYLLSSRDTYWKEQLQKAREEVREKFRQFVLGLSWSAENETPDALRILKVLYDELDKDITN